MSVDITQHLGRVVKSLLLNLHRWPWLERHAARLLGRLTTWQADEFSRFVNAPRTAAELGPATRPPDSPPLKAGDPVSLSPAAFEERFSRLHANARYPDMWRMVAEDAQRTWGSEAAFSAEMARQSQEVSLLDSQVMSVEIVPEWHDAAHGRSYRNVARLRVRYRIKIQWRETTFDREIHLVPAADGWRTLCYPAREKESRRAAVMLVAG